MEGKKEGGRISAFQLFPVSEITTRIETPGYENLC